MGILKAGNEVNPLLLKLGIALAISFVGFLYTHFRFRAHKEEPLPRSGESQTGSSSAELEDESSQASISTETMVSEQVETPEKEDSPFDLFPKASMDENNLMLPECTELVSEEFILSGDPKMKEQNFEIDLDVKKSEKYSIESQLEIKELRDQVCFLREQERNLQMQLLEFYGLKEQENSIKELENRLKIKCMESKIFEMKVQSLQDENQRLQDQISNHSNITLELESARKTVVLLRKQMKTDKETVKSQLSSLREHVSTLQTLERKSLEEDKEVKQKLQRLHDLETEIISLRTMNERLQKENTELVMKVNSANTAASYSYLTEVVDRSMTETNGYRESNKKLMEELERLRMDRCADAEELVYLKWINACLRYELRNFMPEPDRSTARDLSKTLSPKSEEKAKKLIFEYACSGSDSKPSLPDLDSDYYSPSSTITDPGEFDDSPVNVRSAMPKNSSKKNLFHKMGKLILGKRRPKMGRNSGSLSDWDGSSVSKNLTDEMLGPYACGSFSSTAGCISPTVLSDVRSKSLRMDPMEIERITKNSREFVDPREVSRTMSDIPRGRHLRIRNLGEDDSAMQLKLITTNSVGEITEEEDIQKEREKIYGRQISSQKVELLKFAEVLGSSCPHSIVHNKQ